MSSLTLKRVATTDKGTFGVLLKDTIPFCVTLEPIEPVIVKGRYSVIKYDSPHFGRKVFLINNVPGHTTVEIHAGNTVEDTKGCILIGKSFSDTFCGIKDSLDALVRLIDIMPDIFMIEVV